MATAAILIASSSAVSAASFSDIPKGHWAAPGVTAMADAGIIPPSADGKFYGDRAITRAEMAQMASNLLLKVSPNSTADAKAIVQDWSKNGDKALTRYEIALMLANVCEKAHKGNLPAAQNSFSDVPKNHWAAKSVSLMAAMEVMEGYGDGTFRGDKTMDRYGAALVLNTLYKKLAN